MTQVGDQELFEANLAFFQQSAPRLHELISGMTSVNSRLIRVGEDDFDVEYRGIRLYGNGAKEVAKSQCDEQSRWTRFFTSRPAENSVDERAGAFLKGMLAKAEAEGIEFSSVMAAGESYYLVVFGIGLAQHLRHMLDTTKCSKMLLVEPSREFLYHSMFVFDWKAFAEDAKKQGTSIYWVSADRAHVISNELRVLIRCFNSTRVDGMWLYTHYFDQNMSEALAIFQAESGVLLSGLGWLDDEILMIDNTHANLKGGDALMFHRRHRHFDWPVFIVGSGPSIDNDLDVIAANADRAVVVACGTGLGPLLRKGVRPDFYVELENLPQSYTFLESITKQYSLEGITLVATTTIDPRIAPMFDTAILFMRDGLASFPVFCRDPATEISNINPTVTNTGLGFALAAGFHEFYFFGVDLGSKDPRRHHSKETPYMKGVLPYDVVMDKKLPGNFGGEVYTDHVFLWAHDSYEKVLAIHRMGNRFYNCSNGALIAGATPKVARSLNLPKLPGTSKDVVAKLLSECQPYGAETFREAWQIDKHFEEVRHFRDTLVGYCENWDPEHPLDFTDEIVAFLYPNTRALASHCYYRGSLALALLAAHYFYNRTPAEKAPRMAEIIREQLIDMIKGTSDRIVSKLSHLADAPESVPA